MRRKTARRRLPLIAALGVMRQTLSILIVIFMSASAIGDEKWFQGRWVWDREQTIESNAHTRSDLRDELEALMPKSGSSWQIRGDTITAIRDGEHLWSSRFTMVQIAEGRYEVVALDDELESHIILLRTENGFCYTYSNKLAEIDSEMSGPVCFAPDDA